MTYILGKRINEWVIIHEGSGSIIAFAKSKEEIIEELRTLYAGEAGLGGNEFRKFKIPKSLMPKLEREE